MKTLLIISFAASLFSLGLLSSPARAYPCDAREYSTFSTWVALWMQTDEGDYEREDFITDEIFPDYYSATEMAAADFFNFLKVCRGHFLAPGKLLPNSHKLKPGFGQSGTVVIKPEVW